MYRQWGEAPIDQENRIESKSKGKSTSKGEKTQNIKMARRRRQIRTQHRGGGTVRRRCYVYMYEKVFPLTVLVEQESLEHMVTKKQ